MLYDIPLIGHSRRHKNAEWRKIRTVSQKGESVGGNGVEIAKGHEGTFWDDANVFYLARGLSYILNIFIFCHIYHLCFEILVIVDIYR